MREILFRGKRIDNNKLVEGDLIHGVGYEKGNMFILPIKQNLAYLDGCHPLNGYNVSPETVIQFTGVTDKNETKVFENDKVLVHENVCGEIKDWTAKVAFKGGSFCLVTEEDYPICSLFEVCGTFEVIPE